MRSTLPYVATNERGSVLFIQRPREVAAFLARHPRPLPGPPDPPAISAGLRKAALYLLGVLALGLLGWLRG